MVNSSSQSLLGTPQGDLALRVCGSALDGTVVRLAATKCTIGGAADCTLRLRRAGVSPIHCLILRGERGTIVRRWSTDTRLNGSAFEAARLNPGDRLTLGPVELEVLPGDGLGEPTLHAKLAQNRWALTETRQRTRRLLEQLREARKSLAELQNQYQTQSNQIALTQDRIDTFDKQQQAEHEPLQARLHELEIEREGFQSQLAQFQEQLRQLTDQIERSQHHTSDLERNLTEAHEVRQGLEAELARLRAEVADQQQAFAHERSDLEGRLAEQSRAVDFQTTELGECRQQLAARLAEIEQAQGELGELASSIQRHQESDQAAQARIAALEERVCQQEQVFLAERDSLTGELRTAEEQRERLQRELLDYRTQHDQHCQDFYAARQGLQADLANLHTSFTDQQHGFAREREELEGRLAEQTHAKERTVAELEDCRQQLEARLSEIEQAQIEIEELARTVERQGVSDSSAQTQLAAVEARLAEQAQAFATERENFAHQLQTVEAERDQLQGEVQTHQTQLKQHGREVSEAKFQFEQMASALAKAEQAKAELTEHTQARHAAFDTRQEVLAKREEELQREYQRLQAQWQQYQTVVTEEAARRQRESQQQTSALRRERDEVHQRLRDETAALEEQRRLWEVDQALGREEHLRRDAELKERQTELENLRLDEFAARERHQETASADFEQLRRQLEQERLELVQQRRHLEEQYSAQTEAFNAYQADLDQQRLSLEKRQAEWNQFRTELEEELNHQKAEFAARQLSFDSEHTSRAEEANRRESQLAAEAEELERERTELASQRQQLEKQYSDQAEAFTAYDEELKSQRLELETQQNTRQQEQQKFEEELEQRRQELAADRAALAEQQAQWHQAQQVSLNEMAAREEQLEAALRDQQAQFHQEQLVWQQQQDQQSSASTVANHGLAPDAPVLDQADAASTQGLPEGEKSETDSAHQPAEAPLTAQDVIQRWQASSIWKADDEQKPVSADEPENETEERHPPASVENPSTDSDGHEDEESIENYMARLLQRVRGEHAPPPPRHATKAASTPIEPEVSDEFSSEVTPQPVPDPTPFQMSARTVAPEQSSDLVAMRELAVNSARQAIAHSMRRRFSASVQSKLIIIGMSITTAAILYNLAPHYGDVAIGGAVVAIIIAMLWGSQAITILSSVRRGDAEAARANRASAESPAVIPDLGEFTSAATQESQDHDLSGH